jgi:hypothetical protein
MHATLEILLKWDRLIVAAGLTGIAVLAWAYMVYLARGMSGMNMAMPQFQTWGVVDLLLLLVMWVVMMVSRNFIPLLLSSHPCGSGRPKPVRPCDPFHPFYDLDDVARAMLGPSSRPERPGTALGPVGA